MQQFVNDFYTVAGDIILPPATAIQYVAISDFNSVTIINTGLRNFWITGKGLRLFPGHSLVISGEELQVLKGNLYLEFFKGVSKATALIIRKKFI
jgi:hypothetical protein